ncbi:MAG TPA: DUF255 domain-containing protein, partial [Bacteroidetes bacterium]|nr:DUF255 domain-containing protein [Bacteroidota bacterium]
MAIDFMLRLATIIILLSNVLLGAGQLIAQNDLIPTSSIVFIEGRDAAGAVLSRGVGVIVRKNFVAANYHCIAGMHTIAVFHNGEEKEYISDGYLSVEEEKDVIVLSVPGITGSIATLAFGPFPEDGAEVLLGTQPNPKQLRIAKGTVSGTKELREIDLPQVISREIQDFTGGPVFYKEKVAGFCTAGYLDEKYYAYIIPATEVRRLMNRSFIIKSFISLSDESPLNGSYYQKNLMDNLNAVLWMKLPNAERLARKKQKMVLISVYTDWAGWAKLMGNNTYGSKRIIRYLNENFYSVRLNAETDDEILFDGKVYSRNIGSDYHSLAYSLLEGIMDFPSTV